MTGTAGTALAGIMVVEWGRGRPSAYAGKLLRDYGAEVILLERDAGWRRQAFPLGPVPNRNAQLAALEAFLHGGKRSVLLDERTPEGRGVIEALLDRADVLLLHLPIAELEAVGMAPESLAGRFPRLVIVPVTLAGLGRESRYLRHADLVAHAIGGIAYGTPTRVPDPETYPPLRPGGYQADYTTGLTAAIGALLGLQYRRRTGCGQLVDVSAQAVLASFMRLDIAYRTYGMGESVNISGSGRQSPTGRPSTIWGLVPCKDGFFAFQASEQYQWDGLMRMMGDPEWSKDPRFQDPFDRMANWQEIEPYFIGWTLEHTKSEIFHAAQANRVPVFPCYTVAELLDDPQPTARGFFVEIPAGDGIPMVRVPGAVVVLEKTPWSHDPRPPVPGEHTTAILSRFQETAQ